MAPADERLRRALAELAADDAPGLIRDARAEARAEAKAILRQGMVEALLARSARLLATESGQHARDAEPDQQPPEPPAPKRDELAYYVYGVIGESDALPAGIDGMDSRHPVTLIADNGLAAVVAQVPLSEFGEEPLKRNLNDLGWLEAKARAHEEVLERLLPTGPLVPLRLCTIFSSGDHVREMLAREHSHLAEALERLSGRSEWGVKALADPQALARAAGAAEDARALESELQEKAGGGAYLARKKLERLMRQRVDELAAECAETSHARLEEWARDSRLHPPQSKELSGRSEHMLLNGSYLIDEDRMDAFTAVVDELQEQYHELGVVFELTGPWPAYNFAPAEQQGVS